MVPGMLLPSLSLRVCFQRRASGLLKPADVCFELPCLGLDPTTHAGSRPGGRGWVFAGSLCLWDPKRKKGRRTRESQGLARACVRIGTQNRWVQGWGARVCRARGRVRSKGSVWAGGGLWSRGRGGSTTASPAAHGAGTGSAGAVAMAHPSGKSGCWRGRGGTASREALQGLQGPQGSSAWGWQTRTAVPGPRALQGGGPTKRSLPGLVIG